MCAESVLPLLSAPFVPDAIDPGTMDYWPPPLNALLAWSVLFRCKGTLCNYLGYVRTGCMIVGVSVKVGVACYLV